jgi:hypothetical protein
LSHFGFGLQGNGILRILGAVITWETLVNPFQIQYEIGYSQKLEKGLMAAFF